MEEIEKWNELRQETKEELHQQREKDTWCNLMTAINKMGAIPKEPEKSFYKAYHKLWNELIDKANEYCRIANLDDKYGLNQEKVEGINE